MQVKVKSKISHIFMKRSDQLKENVLIMNQNVNKNKKELAIQKIFIYIINKAVRFTLNFYYISNNHRAKHGHCLSDKSHNTATAYHKISNTTPFKWLDHSAPGLIRAITKVNNYQYSHAYHKITNKIFTSNNHTLI